jgi:sugar phosphate isomerase/epimerase
MHQRPIHSADRRSFLKRGALAVTAAAAGSLGTGVRSAMARIADDPSPLFRISLAQWSLHRAILGKTLDPLDFPLVAKRDYGINAVEFVNGFYKDKATDVAYRHDLRLRANGEGVACLLIMCDDEGRLGDPDDAKRTLAIENHYKWLDWANELGCHSIRVNAASAGAADEQRRLAADGLHRLTEVAETMSLNVIVENHGGLSSNGEWLASVIRAVNHPRCGTLPDFGNFRMFRKPDGTYDEYDRYKGVAELLPFAKGVSAKSYDFNERGEETTIDYPRMMKIVADAGYRKHVGIEYEGDRLSEPDGIRATKALLERVRDQVNGQTAPAAQTAASQPGSR